MAAGLATSLSSMGQAARDVSGSRGAAQLAALSKLTPQKMEDIQVEAARKLRATITRMLIQSFSASGLESRSGTMLRALSNPFISISPTRIRVELRDGIKYPGAKKGNVYAAAGVFRYGGVRQPLTKKVGSLYRDLITKKLVPRKQAAGSFGDRAKRTLKKAILKKQITDNPTSKVEKGLRMVAEGKITVLPPKWPFFLARETDLAALQAEWAGYIRDGVRAAGVEAN